MVHDKPDSGQLGSGLVQVVVRSLNRLIDASVLRHGFGEAWCVPGDLTLGSEQVVQPDLFVVAKVPDVRNAEWEDVGVPMLAVEVCHHQPLVTTVSRQAQGISARRRDGLVSR